MSGVSHGCPRSEVTVDLPSQRAIARSRVAGLFHYDVEASTEVAAVPERVWATLVDLDGYGTWNPFTPAVRSTLAVGDPVHLDVVLGPGRRTRSTNTVEVVEAPHRLVWSSTLGHRSLLVTRRTQTVEALPDGRSRYRTHEVFRGPLAPLVALVSRRAVADGFAAVADALRHHVEASPGIEDTAARPQ